MTTRAAIIAVALAGVRLSFQVPGDATTGDLAYWSAYCRPIAFPPEAQGTRVALKDRL